MAFNKESLYYILGHSSPQEESSREVFPAKWVDGPKQVHLEALVQAIKCLENN